MSFEAPSTSARPVIAAKPRLLIVSNRLPVSALVEEGRLQFVDATGGLAPDEGVQRWQRRIEPVWRVVAGGCRLTRDPPALLSAAGFAIERLESAYLPKAPKWAGFNTLGAARAA